jgi:hypothetical protein
MQQRRSARLGALPLIPEHELTARTRPQDTLAVGVAAAARVTLGRNQHMLA